MNGASGNREHGFPMALKSCQLGFAVCCSTLLDERIKLYVFKPLLSDCYYWSQFPTDTQPMTHLEELIRVFKLCSTVVWFLDVVQGVTWERLERWKSWVSISLSLFSEKIFKSICFLVIRHLYGISFEPRPPSLSNLKTTELWIQVLII